MIHALPRRFGMLLSAAIFLLALHVPSVPAQQPESLALQDFLGQLLEADEGIQSARAGYQSAVHKWESSKGGWRPSVDVGAEVGHEQITKTIQEPDDKTTSKYRNQQDLTVTQLIYDFGGTSGQVRLYEALSLEALARLEQARQAALYRGINAYLTVIRYREVLKYLEQSEESMKELSGIQEALVERGSGISPDELRVKAQLANVLAEKLRAEQEFRKARHNFKAVYEVELTEPMIQGLDLPSYPTAALPPDVEPAVQSALNENPYLVEGEQAVARTRHQLTVTESVMYPTFKLVGEAQRKEQDQGAQGVRYEQRATLQMDYRLYSGGSDTEDIRAAKQDIVQARKSVLNQRDSVEEAVRNAWTDMIIVQQQFEQYRNQTNITWEYLSQLKRLQEQGGEIDLTAILIGEKDYLSATSAMVTAEIDSMIAAYTLLYQMGRLEPDLVTK